MIFIPPAPPMTSLTFPTSSVKMDGAIDDRGRLMGNVMLAVTGVVPCLLRMVGLLKYSISLFRIIPVILDITPDPKLKNKCAVFT
jgi:hypothetical protein